MESAYELFQNGTRLLEEGNFHAATVPLPRARDLEPDKCSIREALGRALFGSRRYSEAAEEFAVITERAPTNDYALFCLGRADERLRLFLLGPLAAADGSSRRGAPPAGSGGEPAARAGRLPPVPRPLAAPGGCLIPAFRSRAVACRGARGLRIDGRSSRVFRGQPFSRDRVCILLP